MFKKVQFQSQSSPGDKMVRAAVTPAKKDSPLKWRTVGEVNEDDKSMTLPAKRERPLKWRAYDGIDEDAGSTTPTDKHPKYPRHELLGSRVFEGSEAESCWQNVIDIEEVSWLVEHVLLDQIVFPAAAYIAVAGESVRQLSNGNLNSYTMKDFSITSALILKRDQKPKLHTTLRPANAISEIGQWYAVQITSFDGSQWTEHCVGKISPHTAPSSDDSDVPPPGANLPRHVPQAYWYDVLENLGLKYGPAFQGLDEISTALTDHKASATVSPFGGDLTDYILHPVTIEQCLQVLMVAACRGQGKSLTGLPLVTAIEHLVISSRGQAKFRIRGTAAKSSSGGVEGDMSVMSENGRPTLSIKGCKISPVPSHRPEQEDKLLSFVKWDTDATFRDLNQAFALPHSKPDPLIILDVLKLLSHKNPNLKILELGNGADETTRLVLNTLKSRFGERLYLNYTYAATSLDAAFMLKAAFRGTSNFSVEFYDIEQHLRSSNLQAGVYDLIITTDFISAASPTSKAYTNSLKQLIHPLGYLFLLDTLPGSNVSKDGNSLSQVHTNLLENGFVFNPRDEHSSEAPKVVVQLKKYLKHSRRVTLVVPEDHHALVEVVFSTLQDNGIGCDRCTFEGNIPQGQDMIVLIDFGEPYLYNITATRFRGFANRLSTFKGSIIWVTPSASLSCIDPNPSMILGMTRTLRAETRKDITVVEMEDQAVTFPSSSQSLVKIYQNLSYRAKSGSIDPDYEYAIVDGDIKISRLHWTTRSQELTECVNRSIIDGDGSEILQYPNGGRPKLTQFRSDACYALVGGLGGLGRVIATWMVENGTRSIMFISRSAKEGPETTPFFDELRALGCEVLAFGGDVTSLIDVEAALKQATRPVKGIMQMSAVMRDKTLSQMTFSEWEQCVRPRVQGTWNLHHATSSADLDFFLLLSSICGITGQPAQSNYNSANTFLDAFVNYRHGQNLPASVVDIGLMGCTGIMVRENRELNQRLMAGGYHFLNEQDLLDALTIAIAYSRPEKDMLMNKSQLGLGLRSTKSMTDPSNRVAWKKDARMAISHQFDSLGISTDDEARQCLQSAYQGWKRSP